MGHHDFCIELRRLLIKEIVVTKTAEQCFWWDDTRPNYVTKQNLTRILDQQLIRACEHGVFRVVLHGDCPNKRHRGNPTTNTYGVEIPRSSEIYIWENDTIQAGNRSCVCLCSPGNKETLHWVSDHLVYNVEHNGVQRRQLKNVFRDVSLALDGAGERKPRSGIREYLLRAVLGLNDLIMPETVDSYIERRKRAVG